MIGTELRRRRLRRRITAAGLLASLTTSALGASVAMAAPVEDETAPPVEVAVLGLADGEAPTLPPNVGGWPASPAITAASMVMIDQDSRTVLAARDPDRLRAVASTVKMLTAVTARRLEQDLTRVLVAGTEVAGLEGSGVGLNAGEGWTVRQLLEAMLVRSGNDAAAALAERLIDGGTAAFLEEMRADATRLGLDGAVIVSPSGLDDSNQLSAAHLGLIALDLLADPVLAEIVAQDSTTLPGLGPVPNRNELLRRDSTAIGLKTGFTDAAGHSLVGAAERDGRVTVVVLLDAATAEARFDDALRLFDHASAFASLPALAAVDMGCPGARVHLEPAATSVVVPVTSADLVEVAWPPLRCPTTTTLLVTPSLQRLPLVPVEVTVESVEVAPAGDPDAVLGRWLATLVQDAMRAVGSAELAESVG